MNSKLTENINNQKESLEQSSIEKKVLEGSIDSNYDFNLADVSKHTTAKDMVGLLEENYLIILDCNSLTNGTIYLVVSFSAIIIVVAFKLALTIPKYYRSINNFK